MSSDGVNRINLMRNLYQAKNQSNSSSEVVRELQAIKNEISIANDEILSGQKVITNATNSPYLPDQIFYRKDVVYNSPEETSWKKVDSVEEVKRKQDEKYIDSNRKKLNII